MKWLLLVLFIRIDKDKGLVKQNYHLDKARVCRGREREEWMGGPYAPHTSFIPNVVFTGCPQLKCLDKINFIQLFSFLYKIVKYMPWLVHVYKESR